MPNIKGNKPLNSNSYTKTYKEDLTMARYHVFDNVRKWLQSLSFRTGVIVLLCCIPFYILSFAQMLLPISAAAKGLL